MLSTSYSCCVFCIFPFWNYKNFRQYLKIWLIQTKHPQNTDLIKYMWNLYWIVFIVFCPFFYMSTEKSEEKKYKKITKTNKKNSKPAIETKNFILRFSLWHFLLFLRLAKLNLLIFAYNVSLSVVVPPV